MIAAVVGVAVATGTVVAALYWLRRHLAVIEVYGVSMAPALRPGDRVLVRRTPLARVRAGDIVVYRDAGTDAEPRRGSRAFARRGLGDQVWTIKRAVAVPGDPVPASVAPVVAARPGSPVRAGCLVVLGDNLPHSYDSRDCGYVSAELLLGVVRRRV